MIQTSYFGKAKGMENAVAISQGTPKWFKGEKYPKLAPSWNLVHETDETKYRSRYQNEVLAKLNPVHVADDLEGKILLCWEKPGEFCHRRLAAEWLEKNLLIQVPELGYLDTSGVKPKRIACDLTMFAKGKI
jgi:hypothetical protein